MRPRLFNKGILNMRKAFIISLVLLLITMFFFGIYNVFNKKTKTAESVPSEIAQPLAEPSKQEAVKIAAISDFGVLGPIVYKSSGKLRYYSKEDGTVWESDLNGGDKVKIENFKLSGLQDVTWSSNGKDSISEFSGEGNHYFYAFNHTSGTGVKLRQGIDYVVWDDTGSKILYKFFDASTKKRSIVTSKIDGADGLTLAEIPYFKVSLKQIPHTSIVSFWNYPSANEEGLLKTVSTLGGESKTIFSGRFGSDYLWSPDGTMAVVSSLDQKGGKNISLGIFKMSDASYSDIGIPTLAQKTVWSSDNKTLYYALPLFPGNSAVLPDDYQSGKITTTDTFWKVDISTGKKERIIDPNQITEKYDASSLILSPSEDVLLFINRIDGKLYRISFQ